MNRSDTTPRSFSASQLRTALGDVGGSARPGYLTDIVAEAGRTRQRPAWTFAGRWVPVDMAVGRQGLPRAAVVLIVLSLLVALLVAGTVYVGSRTRPAPLPTEPGAWSRVVIETPSGTGHVVSFAAGPRSLLAVVSVGDESAELYASTDGTAWTRVAPHLLPSPLGSGGAGSNAALAGATIVAADQGYLMLGDGVWASDDGLAWRRLADPADDPDLAGGRLLAATAAGPGLVAVGTNGRAWYSTDGSDWTLAQVPPPPTEQFAANGFGEPTVDMWGVTRSGDRLLAWGRAGAGATDGTDGAMSMGVLWTSADGRTWTAVPDSPEGIDSLATVAAGPDGFVAVERMLGARRDQDRAIVRLSADGRTWDRAGDLGLLTSTEANDSVLELGVSSITVSEAGYVAAGTRAPACLFDPCTPGDVVFWTSRDGRTWTELPSDERFSRAEASVGVVWQSRFVVGGTQDGRPAIWISED